MCGESNLLKCTDRPIYDASIDVIVLGYNDRHTKYQRQLPHTMLALPGRETFQRLAQMAVDDVLTFVSIAAVIPMERPACLRRKSAHRMFIQSVFARIVSNNCGCVLPTIVSQIIRAIIK